MKKFILFSGLMTLIVTLPAWFYLLYKILEMVNATDLMWFIYWAYIPFTILTAIGGKIAESLKD